MRLCNTKKPSGDADIPDDVCEAKTILELMNQKADTGDDVDDEGLGFENTDDKESVETDNEDENKVSTKRRNLMNPRTPPGRASNPMDTLMTLMLMQANERMARQSSHSSSNNNSNVNSLQMMLQMQQSMLQQQQNSLDRIANRLDEMERKSNSDSK